VNHASAVNQELVALNTINAHDLKFAQFISALRSGRDPLAQFPGQLHLPGAPESAQAIKGLESLRGWRRLHIRLTLLDGGTTLLAL
jgi:hypothetical protein